MRRRDATTGTLRSGAGPAPPRARDRDLPFGSALETTIGDGAKAPQPRHVEDGDLPSLPPDQASVVELSDGAVGVDWGDAQHVRKLFLREWQVERLLGRAVDDLQPVIEVQKK